MSRRRTPAWALVALVVVLAGALVSGGGRGTAAQLLEDLAGGLSSGAAAAATELDEDGDGLDTRGEVLDRDLSGGRLDPGPYTGQVVEYDAGEATSVHIDHVRALSDAWEGGADGWDTARRRGLTRFLDTLNPASAAGEAR